MAAGAVGASEAPPPPPEDGGLIAEAIPVAGLPDVLGLRSNDPDLAGRVVGGCGITTRVVPPLWVTFGGFSCGAFMVGLVSRIAP